jgi:hypothetical protein
VAQKPAGSVMPTSVVAQATRWPLGALSAPTAKLVDVVDDDELMAHPTAAAIATTGMAARINVMDLSGGQGGGSVKGASNRTIAPDFTRASREPCHSERSEESLAFQEGQSPLKRRHRFSRALTLLKRVRTM